MARIFIGRIAQTIPMLILVSLVVFVLLEAAPGDPARLALATAGAADQVDERDVAARRLELGLDKPVWERYLRWIGDVVRFDLGESYVNKKPVSELIRERLLASFTLAGVTLFVSVFISIPLGILSAVRAGGALDALIRLLSLAGSSLPSFWLALLGMWIFAAELQWVPALGSFTPRGMILPVAVLTLRTIGLLTRLTRATVLDAMSMGHVPVARSRGLGERRILIRHVFPNAMIPILTVIGLDFASLVAHAAVIEWIFAWPGIGRMGVDAALAGDAPVVLGFVLVASLTVVFANFVVDLSYGLIDPRQRESNA
jgi:ABC-type dipeptide/oligopeptide/nickel transport system permease component